MAAILIPFTLFAIVIMAVVVWYIIQRRKSRAQRDTSGQADIVNLDDLRAMATFAKDRHERIGEYMRANWSGSHAELPGVLTALLIELERDAIARKLFIDRDSLKIMLGGSLRAHKLCHAHLVREALDKVA